MGINFNTLAPTCGPSIGTDLSPLQVSRAALPQAGAIEVPSLERLILLKPSMGASFLNSLIERVPLGERRITLFTLLHAAFHADPDRYPREVQLHLLRSVDALFARDDRVREGEIALPDGPLRDPIYTAIETLFSHLLKQTGERGIEMTPKSFWERVDLIRSRFASPDVIKDYIGLAFERSEVFAPETTEDELLFTRDFVVGCSPEERLGVAILLAFERNDYHVVEALMASELFERIPLELLCGIENCCAIRFCMEPVCREGDGPLQRLVADARDLFALYPPLYCRLLERIAAHPGRLTMPSPSVFTVRFAYRRLTDKWDEFSSNLPADLFAQILKKRVDDLAATGKLCDDVGISVDKGLQAGAHAGIYTLTMRCLALMKQDDYYLTVIDSDVESDEWEDVAHLVEDCADRLYCCTPLFSAADSARLSALSRGFVGLCDAITKEYQLGPVPAQYGVWRISKRPL